MAAVEEDLEVGVDVLFLRANNRVVVLVVVRDVVIEDLPRRVPVDLERSGNPDLDERHG